MHLHIILWFLLFFAGVLAGIVDTVAGGGGLIAVPALLAAGLPPALTLGTNKFQACIGEFNASWHFVKKQKIPFKELLFGFVFAGIGATAGTVVIQILHERISSHIIPWLLLGVLLYVVFAPRLNEEGRAARIPKKLFYVLFGLVIGFYNGFFGPGTGSFWIFALMFFLGCDMVSATMRAKPLNFSGNIVSIVWFMVGGNVNYLLGLIMGAGQLLGTRIGVYLVIHKGTKLIRPLFIIVVSLMLVSLFAKKYFI